MKKIFISASLFTSILFVYSCKDNSNSETKSLTQEITFTKEGELQLIKAGNDSLLASLDIELADDEYKRQTGLMYRQSMDKDQGMLFIFPDEELRSFYMKNTEIALDIIFFNSEKEIVGFQKNAKPADETSLISEEPSKYVLEVNAGLSDLWRLEEGDQFRYSEKNETN